MPVEDDGTLETGVSVRKTKVYRAVFPEAPGCAAATSSEVDVRATRGQKPAALPDSEHVPGRGLLYGR